MSAEWTQAPRGPHFFWLPIPAYASLSVLLWIMHARVWTFILALCMVGLLSYLHMRGRSVTWAVRRIKSSLRGHVVYARSTWYRRRTQHLRSFDLIELTKGDL